MNTKKTIEKSAPANAVDHQPQQVKFDAISHEAALTPELTRKLLCVREQIRAWENAGITVSREDAAYIARRAGFFTHKGGHHVAIHENHKTERLVLITSNTEDWQ